MENEKLISQVNQIIEMLEVNEKEKIPFNVRRFFFENDTKNIKYKLDMNIELKDQNLDEDTLDVLVYIYSYLKTK